MTFPSSLKRRLLGAVLATLALGALPAVHAQPQLLRISTPAAPEDWHVKMLSVFKDHLEKSAPGRFEVRIHHSGTLFKQGAEPVAMQRGNLEMALVSMQDVAKQLPEYSLLTAGYLIRDPSHLAKVYNGPIGAEVSRTTDEKMGIHLLQAVYYGTRQLGLRTPRTVRVPADLSGLKLRMPGAKEWLFLGQALGAQATPLPFPEVYMALKTGTIDAQDNPLPTLKAAKFSEVTKQIVLTSHLVDVLQIAISGKVWKALPDTDRAKLKAAAEKAAAYNDENRLREEKELLEAFRKQGIAITTPDVEAFRRAVLDAYRKSEFAAQWPQGLFERVVATR